VTGNAKVAAAGGPGLPVILRSHPLEVGPRGSEFRAMKDGFAAGEFGEDDLQLRAVERVGFHPVNPRFERIRAHRIAAVDLDGFVLHKMQPDERWTRGASSK